MAETTTVLVTALVLVFGVAIVRAQNLTCNQITPSGAVIPTGSSNTWCISITGVLVQNISANASLLTVDYLLDGSGVGVTAVPFGAANNATTAEQCAAAIWSSDMRFTTNVTKSICSTNGNRCSLNIACCNSKQCNNVIGYNYTDIYGYPMPGGADKRLPTVFMVALGMISTVFLSKLSS